MQNSLSGRFVSTRNHRFSTAILVSVSMCVCDGVAF